jgi:hypothetical protein
MAITKDQLRLIILVACFGIVLLITSICLLLVYAAHQQNIQQAEKISRIKMLEQTLENIPDEIIPSSNSFQYLKDCGGALISSITKDKDIVCECSCSFTQLLAFLQDYNKQPGNIQALHILRDNQLCVTLHISEPKEKTYD